MIISDEQKMAITKGRGPCLVLACPGAGKTFVLTRRIEYLIREGITSGQRILVITFTKAAANEMRQRYLSLQGSYQVTFGTFHSIFFAILKETRGLSKETILDAGTKRYLLLNALRDAGIEERMIEKKAALFESAISSIKNQKHTLEEYEPVNMTRKEFISAYEAYERGRQALERMDFDDLLLETKELLLKNEEVLDRYRRRFSFILVDEAQDMNRVQFEVIRLIASPGDNLYLVGDDDQSIYGFRGADSSILLDFERLYPKSTIIKMTGNFRSGSSIVSAASCLISHNKMRYDKTMMSCRKIQGQVAYKLFSDESQQARYVADRIKADKAQDQNKTIAVLYRNHALSEEIRRQFEEKKPYDNDDIMLIMNYFSLATSEKFDTRLFLSVMNCPDRYLPRGTIGGDHVDINKWIHEPTGFKDGPKRKRSFVEQLLRLKSLPSFAALMYLLNVMGIREYITEESGKEAADKLIDRLAAMAKELPDKRDFLRRISELNTESTSDHKAAICFFYTFHGAKGLEFDDVYIISANDGITPLGSAVGEHDMEEERRMFYVAMTRAKNNLYICALKYNKKDEEIYPSPYIKELMEQQKDH